MSSDTRAAPSSIRERRQRTRASRRRKTLEPPPQLWAKVLVGVHVALAPLLLAGAYPWAAATSAVSSVVLLFAVMLSDRGRPLPWSPGMAVLVGLGFATVLQIVPLPIALVQLLSPLAADDALHVSAMLGDASPAWVPLSRDPGRTRLSLLLGLNVLCTAMALALLVEGRRPRGFLRAIATACVVIVLVSLGHAAARANTVFGLYTPIIDRSFGPIINVNHLSAFASLTALLCLGLGLQEDSGARKGLAFVGATLAACLVLLTGSRGGALSLLLATGIAVWLSRRAGARAGLPVKLALGGLVVAAAAGLALVLFGIREVHGVSDVERLDVWKRSVELALDHWIAGTGRGAFEPAFLFRSSFLARYTHPENVLLQYSTELGLPLTVLALLGFGRGTLTALRASQTSAALAAGGLVLLFLHDLFDFALELPGMAVPAAACAGIAWTRSHASRKSARYVWAIAAAAALGVTALVVRLPVDDPAAIRARLASETLSGAELAQLEHEIAALHPADGLLTGLLGHRLAQHGSPRAGRWLNRSMYLAPAWPDPHVVAALWLARNGQQDQALMEVREAERLHTGAGRRALCEALGEDFDVTRIRQASVDPNDIAGTLQRARACRGSDAAFSAAIDAALVAEGATDYDAHRRHLHRMAATQPDEARRAAEALVEAHPDDAGALAVWIDVLVLVDPPAALAERGRADLSANTAWSLAGIASRAGDREAVDEIVGRLRRDAAGRSTTIASIDARHGRLLAEMGHTEEGIQLLRSSLELDPNGPAAAALLRLAVQGRRLGLARSAAQHICRQQGRDSAACRSAEQQVDRLNPTPPGLAPPPR